MLLQHIELDHLKISSLNMRHGRTPPDISDILPSVRARGILMPLLVRLDSDGKLFEIVAGRRRYFAAKTVVAEQEAAQKEAIKGEASAPTEPITFGPLPCAVMEPGDDVAALEASLLENLARLAPDEMSQYETFARLAKDGRSISEIANIFGITDRSVKRRLALGNLLPKIRNAYRTEDIDAETIRHLTLASKARQKEWLKLFADPDQHAPRGHRLKQWLFGGAEIATGVALFPLENYKGQIVADLFGEESYFADAELFWSLQSEAIAAKRDTLIETGWADVTILGVGDYFQTWEHDKTSKKDGGKVYIAVTNRGEITVHDGWLSRKEAQRKRNAKENGGDWAGEGNTDIAQRPELTKAAQNYLELHRHAAVRHRLLNHPPEALRMMVATAIAGSGLWRIDAEPRCADKEAIADSIANSLAETGFAAERKAVLALLKLPQDKASVVRQNGDEYLLTTLFAALLKHSDEDVMRILSFVMAETLQSGSAAVEALGLHLKVDMADYWQPDDCFLSLIRDKTVINAMLKEVGGKRIADSNITATGKVQKKIITDFLGGEEGRTKVKDWLSGYMRFPFKGYTKNSNVRLADFAAKTRKLFG